MRDMQPPPVTIVTSASSGIGAATARRFARGGHLVAIAARRKALLDAGAAEIEREGGTALSVPIDDLGWERILRGMYKWELAEGPDGR